MKPRARDRRPAVRLLAMGLNLALAGLGGARPYHAVAVGSFARVRHTHVCTEGRVTLAKDEEDGDRHYRVSDAAGRFIVAEVIPALPIPVAPRVGDQVRVCGIRRYDDAHRWYEVHPIETLTRLPAADAPEDP